MGPWGHRSMKPWGHGSRGPWGHGTMGQWDHGDHGAMEPWGHGAIGPCGHWAIELGPLTGLSDVICDLTATGKTLAEHDLKVLDTVFESTAHLIANRVGMNVHYEQISAIANAI